MKYNENAKIVDKAEIIDRSAIKLEVLREFNKKGADYFVLDYKKKEELMDNVVITTPSSFVIHKYNLPESILDFSLNESNLFMIELLAIGIDIELKIKDQTNVMINRRIYESID